MSLTADTMSKSLLPTGDSSRSADTAYSLGTGPCWFRGAWVSSGNMGVSPASATQVSFHDGETGDAFLTIGFSNYFSIISILYIKYASSFFTRA